jgi:hypothetical protein
MLDNDYSNCLGRQEGEGVAVKSPQKRHDQVLGVLSVKETKGFLMDSLNLPWAVTYPDHRDYFEFWLNKWQRWFTFQRLTESGDRETAQIPRERLETFAIKLRTALRRIWYEKDARLRDWYFYRLRDEYHRMIVRAENPDLIDPTDSDAVRRLIEIENISKSRGDDASQRRRLFERVVGLESIEEDAPKLCPFEAAAYWLQVNQKLMVHCEGPTCPAPFFFRSEKGQKFCSPECANHSRRQSKLAWWNENRKGKNRKK